MIRSTRPYGLALAVLATAAILSACSSARFGGIGTTSPRTVESVNPVASSTVESQTLPPIGAADGSITTAETDDTFLDSSDPALATTVASADGSFVSLDDVSDQASITTPGGRDLSSPLTVTKLLGAWDVIAGADRCRLNLTQTAKAGTNRYRASTPGCAIAPLARVATWRLAGTQIQLYDDNGAIIGSLLLSGNRFLGTLAGGIAVSMAG
jgi:hypothetical protein